MSQNFRFGTKILLFLSSYCFLYLLLFIKFFNYTDLSFKNFLLNNIISISLLILILVLIISIKFLFKELEDSKSDVIIIEKEINYNENNMLYFITYILPFIFPFTEIREILIYFLIFTFIGIIYINSNMFQINPTLNLLRYKLYNIKTKNGKSLFLITKREIELNKKIKVYKDKDISFY